MAHQVLASLADWFATLPRSDGYAQISAPRNFGADGEVAYAQKARVDASTLNEGIGAVNVAVHFGCDTSGPALEVGCGTGYLSMGLAKAWPAPPVLLTDPSPVFLGITRGNLEAQGIDAARVALAILDGADMALLPAGIFSLIAMRSTLHHIVDVEGFIRAAGAALRPGGVLTFFEPCMEGLMLMAAMAQFIPLVAASAGRPLTDEHKKRVQSFIGGMKFLSRRDMDKSRYEDKHLIRPEEIMVMGRRAGLDVDFLPNSTYAQWAAAPDGVLPPPCSFSVFAMTYLEHLMRFPPDLVATIRETFVPYFTLLDDLQRANSGPAARGVFICRKP